jgi:hypothetical protein
VQAGAGKSGIIAGSTVGLLVLIVGVVWIMWKQRTEFFNHLRLRVRTLQTLERPSIRQNPCRPPSYQASTRDEIKHAPTEGRAEMEVRSKTPRLTLGPFGNNPPFPFFTRGSVIRIPPYTPSAESDKSMMQWEVTPESREKPPPSESAVSPVELPASPVSFSLWEKQRSSLRLPSRLVSMPPRVSIRPFTPFSLTRKPLPPERQDNFF